MYRPALVRIRALLGATQEQLGELLGLDKAAVHRLEAGERVPRGLVLQVILALRCAEERAVPLEGLLDGRTPLGRRLYEIFRGAYGPD